MNGTLRGLIASVLVGLMGLPVAAQPVNVGTGLSPEQVYGARPGPPAPPTPEQQAEARARIDRLLQGRIDLASQDQAAVFGQLRELAEGPGDDPATRYVLLRLAINAGVRAGGLRGVGEIADELARSFAIDGPALQVEVMRRVVDGIGTADGPGDSTIEREFSGLVERVLMADRIELARQLLAVGAVARDHGALDAEVLAAWSPVVSDWAAAADEAGAAALRLVQHPDDPTANLVVGRYLCFVKGRWQAGLPMLARGGDDALRGIAFDDIRVNGEPAQKIAAADGWRLLAERYEGIASWRLRSRADEILRGLYPVTAGLTRLEVDEKMLSRPLFVFGPRTAASEEWQAEHLHFWANHGREGPGSWASVMVEGGRALLVANRAGYVQTREQFPPEGVSHYRIEASIWSDMLPGTSLEFCGQRMYFGGAEGISLEGGWRPGLRYPLGGGFNEFVIEGAPDGISLTVNGQYLGTMETGEVGRGLIVLRGWEGHVRCRAISFWMVPDGSLAGYVRGGGELGVEW